MATYSGTPGDDLLVGRQADDTLVGYAGNDTIDGKGGADRMEGGPGNDYYFVDNLSDDIVELPGEGFDTVQVSVSGYTMPNDVEAMAVEAGVSVAHGNSADNRMVAMLKGPGVTLYGHGGNDVICGSNGNDFLYGGDGNDELAGFAGTDVIEGGDGNDEILSGAGGVMRGGAGDDIYRIAIGSTAKIEENQGEGIDYVYVYGNTDYTLGSHLEHLALRGKGNLSGTGNELNNAITGNGGNNLLAGLGGNDSLFGGAGEDTFEGGLGNDRMLGGYDRDTLNGGAGADWLDGGQGFDLLTGGAGRDTFVFGTAYYRDKASSKVLGSTIQANADLVTDFVSDEDRIALSISTFSALSGLKPGAVLTKDMFVEGPYAKEADDFFLYDQTTGKLWYDANGSAAMDGWTGRRLVATFTDENKNHPKIVASDFFLIA